MQSVSTVQATIASGQALSGPVDLRFLQLVGLQMPAAWDAADVTLQTSPDGVTYGDVFLTAGELKWASASVAAGRVLQFDVHQLQAVRFVKVRSGNAASPVNQTAERVITLIVRGDC